MEPLKVLEDEIPGSAPGYVGSEPGDARRRLWTNLCDGNIRGVITMGIKDRLEIAGQETC